MPLGNGCCIQEAGLLSKPFSLWQYHSPGQDYNLIPRVSDNSVAKSRFLALNNRVIGGLLITATRKAISTCPSRFTQLEGSCQMQTLSNQPFGSDPVFVQSSSLYGGLDPSQFYSPGEINPLGVPYGFFPAPAGSTVFPVYLDVNVDQTRASEVLAYMQDGFFIDGDTQSVAVEFVSFNQALQFFSYTKVTFIFTEAGEIQVRSRVDTVPVNEYSTPDDYFRACLEVLFVINWAVSVHVARREARHAWKRGLLGEHMSSMSFIIDFLNFTLSGVQMLFWLILVFGYLLPFSIPARFNVYADLKAPARYFRLDNGGAGLAAAQAAITTVTKMSMLNTLYAMLNGLNIIFLCAGF